MNCSIIAEWCKDKQEAVGIGLLISGCRKFADDMLTQRVNDPDHYLGTPDDQEMVTMFGEYFGDIHIGTGDISSGNRVTDLEYIRWRATIFGASGQLERDAQKLQAERNKSSAKSKVPDPAIAILIPPPSNAGTQAEKTTAAASTTSNKRSKKCGNINCPHKARYDKALSALWTKCKKDCLQCGPGKGGQVHVCPDLLCKQVLQYHMSAV